MRLALGRAAAIVAVAAPLPAIAQDIAGAPTPERELSTDRPDKTESPFTVPTGRIQIEFEAASYTRDWDDGFITESVAIAPVNLKYGVGRDTDLQLIVEPYLRQSVTGRTGAKAAIDGFGDVTLRLKHNLRGNDGGRTAFGLMPFVKLPTSSGGVGNAMAEFGIIAPLAVTLSDAVGVGLMTEIDLVADDDGGGYRLAFTNSATIGVSMSDRLGVYAELFTERGADWIVTGDAGVTYALTDTLQLDAGANLGITDAADDIAVFAGFSRRF